MKLLVRVAVVGLIGLLLVAGLAWFLGGRVARVGLEQAGTHALGVETRVASLGLRPLAGELTLAGLTVANPEPFDRAPGGESGGEPRRFATLEAGALEVSLGSLTSDRVEASLLSLEGVELRIERAEGGTNFGRILANLEAAVGGESAGKSDGDSAGKRFLVRRVEIRAVEAHVDLVAAGGELAAFTVRLPELVLEDVGADGAPLSTVVAQIVHALLSGVIEAGAGTLPADLIADLGADLAALGSELEHLGDELSGELEDVLGEARDGLEEDLEGVLDGAGEALDDLLGTGEDDG